MTNLRKLSLLIASLALVANAFCTEIPISKKLTLSEVMALGFRPSNLTPYNLGPVRCWEPQEIVLSFKGGYKYAIKAESITFNVFDDDQIASIEIYGNDDFPITLDKAVEESKAFYERFGSIPEEFNLWLESVYRKKRFSPFGHVVKVEDGVRAGIQLLPTLQRIDQKPTLLGVVVNWEYLGTGSLGGSRSKPVVSPPGYDWDMSHEAWRNRIIEKGSQKPKASPPDHRVPNDSWFKWLIFLFIGMVGAFFVKRYYARSE